MSARKRFVNQPSFIEALYAEVSFLRDPNGSE